MTGNWDLIKFRDIQVAEDIAKKAELGWFDVEFTMYGCAYLNKSDDKMYYKISSRAEDIYDYVEYAVKDDIYPSQVETLTLKCPVPMGTKELIAKDIKKELAKKLREKYPKDFFVLLNNMANLVRSNQAKTMLWEDAEKLEGKFDSALLRRFEDLVHYSYGCQKLLRSEYEKLLAWIATEYKNMDENFDCKDIFEKTMYGFAYEENDVVRFVENARRETVYEKVHALERKGVFVTPVKNKTFWYNYEYRLTDVMDDFKKILRSELDAVYRQKIKNMRNTEVKLSDILPCETIEVVEQKWGVDCAATMMRYVHRWGILT